VIDAVPFGFGYRDCAFQDKIRYLEVSQTNGINKINLLFEGEEASHHKIARSNMLLKFLTL
jgi:hypothetical protein